MGDIGDPWGIPVLTGLSVSLSPSKASPICLSARKVSVHFSMLKQLKDRSWEFQKVILCRSQKNVRLFPDYRKAAWPVQGCGNPFKLAVAQLRSKLTSKFAMRFSTK